jgi:hypothetical protein
MKLMETAKQVLPRQRRWRSLLASLTLDPDDLPRPIEPPDERTVLVCGSPRTGTALVSALLWRPPRVLSVMEPWDGLRLPPADLAASLRAEVEGTGGLSRGRLDVDATERTGAVVWCRDGQRPVAAAVDHRWVLAIKWPAFWRYLDLLPTARFVVCLRDPESTVASYSHTSGRLADGFEYDVPFHRALNAAQAEVADRDERRALLYQRIHERIVPHLGRPEVHVVRYERWATDRARQLADLEAFVGAPLSTAVAITPSAADAGAMSARQRDAVARLCTIRSALGY